jgi:hypothetical protein
MKEKVPRKEHNPDFPVAQIFRPTDPFMWKEFRAKFDI